jgi:hypothetical protein
VLAQQGIALASLPLLHKPFTPEQLSRAVREAIDAAPP